MNKITLNPPHFYTRKDVGSGMGFLLDSAFFSFFILVALGMMAFAFLILFVNHVITPSLILLSKLHPNRYL